MLEGRAPKLRGASPGPPAAALDQTPRGLTMPAAAHNLRASAITTATTAR